MSYYIIINTGVGRPEVVSVFDLQKASVLKRFSAFIFDAILLGIIAVGISLGLSALTGYDAVSNEYTALLAQCESKYGVDFGITEDDYLAMDDESKATYDNAYAAFTSDERAMNLFKKTENLTLLIITLGLFLAFFIYEFVVPLLLGNGMTLGKKVFSVAVMHRNGVRISPMALFVRAMLGKYAVETMVPIAVVLVLYFNIITFDLALTVVAGMAIVQLVMIIRGKTNPLIHDAMAWTVAVDMDSQMIYDTEEDLIKAKEEFYAEKAAEDRSY